MSDVILTASNLGIMRGERVLFEGVSFEAGAGEAVALRGANGAGKTTLLRILAGLTEAGAGEMSGASGFHWMSHKDGLKPHETPAAHLALWSKAWGSDAAQIGQILERVGLTRPQDVAARHLSAGQRRRVVMGRMLLERRPLWLLDEPFSALDVHGRTLMLDLINMHRVGGGAVVAAIHGEAGFKATREVML